MKKAFPAIFEVDPNNNYKINVDFPDLPNVNFVAFGMQDAIQQAQDFLASILEKKQYQKFAPTPIEDMYKKYPGKKIYLIAPAKLPKLVPTSPSTHYLVLKIVPSNKNDFNVSEVTEITNAYDKIILYCTLLKHADIDNEDCTKYDDIKKDLYKLKDILIENYSKFALFEEKDPHKFFNTRLEFQNCFSCCRRFNMGHTNDIEDCMCGFYSYELIKKQLDEFNCFEDMQAFALRFLSNELKIVGLKLDYINDENLWN